MKRMQNPRVGDQLVIPNLGVFDVIRIFEGGHNRIVLQAICQKGQTKVIKVFGETVEIDEESATGFIKDIYTYRQALQDLGVTVPPLSEIQIFSYKNEISGKLNVTEISPFYGASFEDLLLEASGKAECLAIQERMSGCLGSLFEKSPGEFLRVGIDLIPRNFTGNNKDWYIDLVPSKLRKGDSFQLEIPEVEEATCFKVGLYRHYDKLGVCHVLLVQMAKLRPEMYLDFALGIEEFLSRKGETETLKNFQERLAVKKIVADNHDIEVISKLSFIDIYHLREIACFYCYKGLMTRDELRDFFSDSHFQDKPLPKRVVGGLKSRLIKPIT